ncbi:MAG: metallophosphoesterase [Fibromonadaceae bacterium]|jgi:predicted MPP superfamily phosphohydrolase|nr:metallophosphoesterase [Fibromonadaceae bacterium]
MNLILAIIVSIAVLSFYVGTNYYFAKTAYQWLNLFLPNINGKIFAVIYTFIASSMFLSFLPIPYGIKKIVSWVGAYWVGVYAYLLILIPLACLIVLLKPNFHFHAGLIVVLLIAGLVGYGTYKANLLKHVSYEIQTKKSAFSGNMKIVLISDLHLGAVNSEKNFPKIIQGINNLKPDIVCIVGDIFNDDLNLIKNPAKVMDLLKSINAKHGVYASLGNHDGGKTFNEMIRFLEQSNIKLLNDEHVIIDERLVLIGRVDPSPIGGFGELHRKDITDILSSINHNLPIVVMDHNPSNLKHYGNEIDLLLSGHTHAGQIFPFNLLTSAIHTVNYGHYQKDSNSPHVIVTSGASTWGMPMRVGTDNEIVEIFLNAIVALR